MADLLADLEADDDLRARFEIELLRSLDHQSRRSPAPMRTRRYQAAPSEP
jgi:hypothetical protein